MQLNLFVSTKSLFITGGHCASLVICILMLRPFSSVCLIFVSVILSAVFVRVISQIDLHQSSHRAVLGDINLPRLAWVQFLQPAGKTNSNARLVIACPYHDAVTDSRTVSVEETNKIVTTWVRIITIYSNQLRNSTLARNM